MGENVVKVSVPSAQQVAAADPLQRASTMCRDFHISKSRCNGQLSKTLGCSENQARGEVLRIAAYSFALLVALCALKVSVEVFGSEPVYVIFSAAQKNKPIASLMFRSRVGFWTACPKVNPHRNGGTEFPPFNAAIAAHYEPDIDSKLILHVADRLVAMGCDINAYDSDGFTPLHRSIYFPDAAAVRYLLTKNPDLSLLAKEGSQISEKFSGMSALLMAKSLQSEDRTPRDKAELELIEKMLIAENDAT